VDAPAASGNRTRTTSSYVAFTDSEYLISDAATSGRCNNLTEAMNSKTHGCEDNIFNPSMALVTTQTATEAPFGSTVNDNVMAAPAGKLFGTNPNYTNIDNLLQDPSRRERGKTVPPNFNDSTRQFAKHAGTTPGLIVKSNRLTLEKDECEADQENKAMMANPIKPTGSTRGARFPHFGYLGE